MLAEGHTELRAASGASVGGSNMAEDITAKIKSHETAPFDSRSPSRNQTGSCLVTLPAETAVTAGGRCLHVQTVPLPLIRGVGLG